MELKENFFDRVSLKSDLSFADQQEETSNKFSQEKKTILILQYIMLMWMTRKTQKMFFFCN